VTALTESVETEWSFATIRAPGERRGRVRRFGSWVGDERVVYVGEHPRTGRPTVWLTAGAELCQAQLGSTRLRSTQLGSAQLRSTPLAASVPARRPVSPRQHVLSRIRRVSNTETHVDRSAVDEVLRSPSRLLRGVRVDPDGAPGFALRGIRPGTVLHAVGLRTGDRLLDINGFSLRNVEDAMAAYARLRTASRWELRIARNDQTRTLIVRIR
jgi:general secretion pathway protein C